MPFGAPVFEEKEHMNTFILAFLSVVIVLGPLVVAAFCGWITNSSGGFFRGSAFSWVVAAFVAALALATSIAGANTLWTFADGEGSFGAWVGITVLWAIGGWFVWEWVESM